MQIINTFAIMLSIKRNRNIFYRFTFVVFKYDELIVT